MKDIIERYQSFFLKYEILLWENEPTSYRFNARISFIDHSVLNVKEYLFRSGRKYSYHWQDKDGQLLIRWDNARHWREVPTFPHHKHLKNEVISSVETTIEDVLQYISRYLKSRV